MSVKLERSAAGHRHYCQGCKEIHVIPHGWVFNDNFEAPTFTPSVRHRWEFRPSGKPRRTCHYFIRDGKIEFCGDSTHGMANRTADLLPISESES